MWAARRRYRRRLGYFQLNVSAVLPLHCPCTAPATHGSWARPAGDPLLLRSWQADSAVKIQAFFRAWRARGDYRMLGEHGAPPPPAV